MNNDQDRPDDRENIVPGSSAEKGQEGNDGNGTEIPEPENIDEDEEEEDFPDEEPGDEEDEDRVTPSEKPAEADDKINKVSPDEKPAKKADDDDDDDEEDEDSPEEEPDDEEEEDEEDDENKGEVTIQYSDGSEVKEYAPDLVNLADKDGKVKELSNAPAGNLDNDDEEAENYDGGNQADPHSSLQNKEGEKKTGKDQVAEEKEKDGESDQKLPYKITKSSSNKKSLRKPRKSFLPPFSSSPSHSPRISEEVLLNQSIEEFLKQVSAISEEGEPPARKYFKGKPKHLTHNELLKKAVSLGIDLEDHLHLKDELISVADITKYENINYFLSPVIPENTVTLLGGPQQEATLLAISLGYAIVLKTKFLDRWSAEKPENVLRRVLYVNGYLEDKNLKNQVQLLGKHFAGKEQVADPEQARKNFMLLPLRQSMVNLLTRNDQHKIEDYLFPGNGVKTSLLIIDNMRSLTEFNDNDQYWSCLFSWLHRLRRKGCSSMLVHDNYNRKDPNIAGPDNIISVYPCGKPDDPRVKIAIQIRKSPLFLKNAEKFLKGQIHLHSDSPKWENITPALTRKQKDDLIVKLYNDGCEVKIIAMELGVTIAAIFRRLDKLRKAKRITKFRKIPKPKSGTDENPGKAPPAG